MTKNYILKWFDYNKSQGLLIWKDHWHKRNQTFLVGKIAGHIYKKENKSTAYLRLRIGYKSYFTHQIIYFLETGKWVKLIDHIDGDGLNNKFKNLRPTDNRRNAQNTVRQRNGKLVGAYRRGKKWRACIRISGKTKGLGTFDTELQAHQRYLHELKRLGFSTKVLTTLTK